MAKKNFGCGSSRARAHRHQGRRGKLRNRGNLRQEFLPECHQYRAADYRMPEAAKDIEDEDEVEIQFDTGMIYDRTKGTEYKGQAFPEFMQKIIQAEGTDQLH